MIWPFKTTPKTQTKVPQLSEVRMGGRRYAPQPDITAQEVALLIPVFMSAYGLSREEYVEKNNLMRHFAKVEE